MSLFSLAEGRVPRSGRGGRRFKSCHSDQLIKHLAKPRKKRAQEIAQETYVLTSVIEFAKRALLHCANHQSSMRPNWVRTRRQARQPAPSSAYNAGIKNTSAATASVCSIESGSPCGLMRRRSLRPQTYRLVAEFLAGRRKSPHKCDFRQECGVGQSFCQRSSGSIVTAITFGAARWVHYHRNVLAHGRGVMNTDK